MTKPSSGRSGEANALGNLGNAYNLLGDTQQALTSYEQQLSIAAAVGDLCARHRLLHFFLW